MKLLRIKIPKGYQMLCKDFEIDFLTKTRINKSANNDDLIELAEDLFYPKETVFVGKNSSGKTTTIHLITMCLHFLQNGRIYSRFFNENDLFAVEMIFYENDLLYKYCGEFVFDKLASAEFLTIVSEDLYVAKYNKTTKKDLSNATFAKMKGFNANVHSDTSSMNKFLSTKIPFFVVNAFEDDVEMIWIFSNIINQTYGNGTFIKLVNLFDDSIEKLEPSFGGDNKLNGFKFKRVNNKEMLVSSDTLRNILSSGTIRGINLYGAVIMGFIYGTHILVDELEKNFNKNLIGNLIQMINDPSINTTGASLIYSTHYSELLDETKRCDNVNVLHREKDVITLKNMHTDYAQRTDMLKSSRFDQNAFDNLLNYEQLIKLKRAIRRR